MDCLIVQNGKHSTNKASDKSGVYLKSPKAADAMIEAEFSGSFVCSDYSWSLCHDKIVMREVLGYFAYNVLSTIVGRQ
jgi:hypothetical protein